MKNAIYLLVIVALAVSGLSGCASCISSSTNTLPIVTQPVEATCEIVDVDTGETIVKAKTPYTAILDGPVGLFDKTRYKIKLRKNGYFPYEAEIITNVNGWYLANLAFGPWALLGMLFIDPNTGVMWKLDEDNINVKLYQDTPEGMISMAQEKYNGLAALKESDFEKAISDTSMALALHSEYFEAYYVRGISYAALGQLDKALADLNVAISLKPYYPDIYKERGNIYMTQGKFDMALSDFNKALAFKPDFSEVLFGRGYIHKMQNNVGLAKAEISQACKQGFQRACNFQF